MYGTRLSLLSLIASLSLSPGVATALAAETAAGQDQPAASRPGAAARRGNRLETLSKELNLTDAQKAKVEPLLKEQTQKARELQQNQSLSNEEKRAKRTELRQNFNKQMKEILTAEQFEKWQKQANARNRRPAAATPPPAQTH